MTGEQITLRGMVLLDGTLQLPGPVEVVVRSTPPETTKESILDVLARIDKEREAIPGYKPRTAEEIDASVQTLRDEWEERWQQVEQHLLP